MSSSTANVVGINKMPRGVVVFLILLTVVLALIVGGFLVENASLGSQSSWQRPGVGTSVNGYSGAGVGSAVYKATS